MEEAKEFAQELRDAVQSSCSATRLEDHLLSVKEQCYREAQKGLRFARCCLPGFSLSFKEELLARLKAMGFENIQTRRGMNKLFVHLMWDTSVEHEEDLGEVAVKDDHALVRELAEMVRALAPVLDRQVDSVVQRCKDEAKRGYTEACCWFSNFDPKTEKELCKRLRELGLQIVSRPRAHGANFLITVSWMTSVDDVPLPKRQRTRDVVTPDVFCKELRDLTLANLRSVDDHLGDVKRRCRQAANSGEMKTRCTILGYIHDPEEIRLGIADLGLSITKFEGHNDMRDLVIDIEWSSSLPMQDNIGGNHEGCCRVCFSESSVLSRLHPCGHLLGVCCASRFHRKICPFCRQHVGLILNLYEP